MTKLFVWVGIIGGLAIAYLVVFAIGPIAQLPPSESLLTGSRAKGFVPMSVNLEEDEAAEEAEEFGVPARCLDVYVHVTFIQRLPVLFFIG